jgi:hypothetical protein
MLERRWKMRPSPSTWGDFGDDDERGRLNLLTPQKVLEGIAEVKVGRKFCLSLPLDLPGGMALNANRHPPKLSPVRLASGKPAFNYAMRCDDPMVTDVFSDDDAMLSLQYSTHWDSLSHVGQTFDIQGNGAAEDVFYNGFRATIDIAGSPGDGDCKGVRRLGVENMAEACIQGRAVMVDLAAHYPETGAKVGYSALMRMFEADGVTVEAGDMVCLRTGFDRMLISMNGAPDKAKLMTSTPALDGRDDLLLDWITNSGVVALISDNYAVEALPATPGKGDPCSTLPLHEHCLFRLGVHLGELWFLSELADWLRDNHRSRFLLTAPPLRLPGAVASPASPIATV